MATFPAHLILYHSINPNYCVSYIRPLEYKPIDRKHPERHNESEGILRARAATKIKNAIGWMVTFAKPKTVYQKSTGKKFQFLINFITLTLSEKQKHSDEEIKELMLRPFLKWIERNGCKLWLWKAETQKNGNIHFHITTESFIHWKSIRKKWNSIQSKHGYLRKYTKGNVRNDPNSTDVHAVIRTDEIGRYMAKYMTKNSPGRRLITGRLWGCSASLSQIKVRINSKQQGYNAASYKISECTTELPRKKNDFCRIKIFNSSITPLLSNPLTYTALRDAYEKISPKLQVQTAFEID